jgi:hypothetical protein
MLHFSHVPLRPPGITLGAATPLSAAITHFHPAPNPQTRDNSSKPSSDKKPVLEKKGLKPLTG